MTSHSSASVREHHANRISRTNTIINALKQRAQAVLNDKSIDAQSRSIIRHALETNDPWLAELVRRADAGGNIDDTFDFSQTPDTSKTGSNDGHIEGLVEIICGAAMSLQRRCSCLWENLQTPHNLTYSHTPRSTSPSLAAVS